MVQYDVNLEQHNMVLDNIRNSEIPGIKVLKPKKISIKRIIYHLSLLAYMSSPEERRFISNTIKKLENSQA